MMKLSTKILAFPKTAPIKKIATGKIIPAQVIPAYQASNFDISQSDFQKLITPIKEHSQIIAEKKLTTEIDPKTFFKMIEQLTYLYISPITTEPLEIYGFGEIRMHFTKNSIKIERNSVFDALDLDRKGTINYRYKQIGILTTYLACLHALDLFGDNINHLADPVFLKTSEQARENYKRYGMQKYKNDRNYLYFIPKRLKLFIENYNRKATADLKKISVN